METAGPDWTNMYYLNCTLDGKIDKAKIVQASPCICR